MPLFKCKWQRSRLFTDVTVEVHVMYAGLGAENRAQEHGKPLGWERQGNTLTLGKSSFSDPFMHLEHKDMFVIVLKHKEIKQHRLSLERIKDEFDTQVCTEENLRGGKQNHRQRF